MTLDPVKVKELENKLSGTPTVEPHPDVPKHMYARAEMKEHEGKLCPTFTRVRTKTYTTPIDKLDALVDTMCNGSEEPWILKDILQIQRRPGKYDSISVIAVFLCVDEIVLPTLDTDTENEAVGVDDVEQKAAEWQNSLRTQ